jgi:glycosyltransferase involved in cell wall biosynthesis
MKFCLVTTFFPPYHFGGDAIVVGHLANVLADAGHHVQVVHCADSFRLLSNDVPPSPFAVDPRVKIRTLHSPWRALSPILTFAYGKPVLKKRALGQVLSEGFDVIHWHNISLVAGPGGLHHGRGIRLCTLHDYWLMCPTSLLFKNNRSVCDKPTCFSCSLAYRRPPQLWRRGRLLERSIQQIDRYLAPSLFVRDKFRESGLGIDPTVIPHFLPETAVSPARSSRSYYLFVGRIEKHKGLHTVLPFFRGEDRELVVAGAGTAEPELRNLCRDLPNVRFLGRVRYADLPPLYAGAKATLIPSISLETFGLTALESLAQCTPVIAHKIGALPETITRTGGGLLYSNPAELGTYLNGLTPRPV